MPVSINVNRLSLVHEASGGVSSATLPDVCLTPGAGPLPYPNTSFSKDLAGGTRDVVADGGHSIAVRGSSFAASTGDEPGKLGGVISGVRGRESTWLSYSLDVKVEGRNACRLTDKMLHNRGNTINCAGVVQPTLKEGGTVVVLKSKDEEHHGKYSLQVDVFLQLPKPPAPPPPAPAPKAPPPKRLRDARVTVTAKDGDSWQGDTTPGGGKKSKGRVLFDRLAAGPYKVDVHHDCYAEAPKNRRRAVVNADPEKHEMTMVVETLVGAANRRGVRVGARSDVVVPALRDGQGNIVGLGGPPPTGKDAKETETTRLEYNDVIFGTFLGSRCGDSDQNRALTDLTGDKLALLGVSYKWVEGSLIFAEQHKKGLQVTPLVWPAPIVTPGWPAGHPASRAGQPGYIPPAESYVAKRAAATNRHDVASKRQFAMEVHEAFIRRTIRDFKGPLIPGTPLPAQWIPTGGKPVYVVCNEVLNMRYHGQENATEDKDFARDHPLWQLFGTWDVKESRENLKSGFEDAIEDEALWRHIARCFEIAHEEDPEALLLLNDYSIEGVPPSLDYRKLAKARDDALRMVTKWREDRISGEPRKVGGKVRKSAEQKRDESKARAKKKREAVYDDPLPKSVDDPTRKYLEAIEAAEKKLDNDMDGLARKYAAEMQEVIDRTKGLDRYDDERKGAVKFLEESYYKPAAAQIEGTWTQALAAAEGVYKAAYVKIPPGVLPPGSPPVAPGTPPPPGVPPAKAEAARAAILKTAARRHAAGKAFWRAVHRIDRRFFEQLHAIWKRFRKDYSDEVSGLAKAYDRAEKPQLFYRMVRWLLRQKGAWKKKLVIGFQMHHPAAAEKKWYRPADIRRNIRRYAKLDLPVFITELDVTTPRLDASKDANSKVSLLKKSDKLARKEIDKLKASFPKGPLPGEAPEQTRDREWNQNQQVLALSNKLAQQYYEKHRKAFTRAYREQAEVSRKLIEACLSCKNCLGIHTWNVADYRSAFRSFGYWFQESFTCDIPNCQSTHPPGEYDRKPSYHAVTSAFLASPKQYSDKEIREGKARKYVEKLEKAESRRSRRR